MVNERGRNYRREIDARGLHSETSSLFLSFLIYVIHGEIGELTNVARTLGFQRLSAGSVLTGGFGVLRFEIQARTELLEGLVIEEFILPSVCNLNYCDSRFRSIEGC